MSALRVLIPTYVPRTLGLSTSDAAHALSPQTVRTIDDLMAIGAISRSDVLVHENCALLVQSRADLLARAYADPSVEEFLFLDDDIGVGAGAVQALRELNLLSVGCGYTGRTSELTDKVLGMAADPCEILTVNDRRLLKMRWMAFGCMLLRREAIDRLYASCEHHRTETGHYDAISPWTPLVRDIKGVPRLLDEGYSCCERLSEVGVTTWCFLDAIVSHAGRPCFAGSMFPVTG